MSELINIATQKEEEKDVWVLVVGDQIAYPEKFETREEAEAFLKKVWFTKEQEILLFVLLSQLIKYTKKIEKELKKIKKQ